MKKLLYYFISQEILQGRIYEAGNLDLAYTTFSGWLIGPTFESQGSFPGRQDEECCCKVCGFPTVKPPPYAPPSYMPIIGPPAPPPPQDRTSRPPYIVTTRKPQYNDPGTRFFSLNLAYPVFHIIYHVGVMQSNLYPYLTLRRNTNANFLPKQIGFPKADKMSQIVVTVSSSALPILNQGRFKSKMRNSAFTDFSTQTDRQLAKVARLLSTLNGINTCITSTRLTCRVG